MIEERSRLNDPCPRVLGSPLVGIHRGVQGVPSLPTAKLGRDSHRYDAINVYFFANLDVLHVSILFHHFPQKCGNLIGN